VRWPGPTHHHGALRRADERPQGCGLPIDALPRARELLAERGHDSDGFRAALEAKGITACIPPRKNRKVVIAYDKTLYRQRHRIEHAFDD
jgi:transposase